MPADVKRQLWLDRRRGHPRTKLPVTTSTRIRLHREFHLPTIDAARVLLTGTRINTCRWPSHPSLVPRCFVRVMNDSTSRPPSLQQRSLRPAKHLALQPTGTDAFPSTLDEEEGNGSNSSPHLVERVRVPQLSEAHEAGTPIHTPPLSGNQSPAFRYTLATRHSGGFMQRIRRAGAHLKSSTPASESENGDVEIATQVLHGKLPPTSLPPQIPPLSFGGATPGDESAARSNEELPKLILHRHTSKRASTSGSVPSREGRTNRTFKRLSLVP